MTVKILTGFFILFFTVPLVVDAQKRDKKNPYAGYWEQQEKQEQFDKIAKEGLQLFQEHKFELAKKKYQEALKIIPTDQRTIAKIRDIDLLIEKQKNEDARAINHSNKVKKDTTFPSEVPDTLILYLTEPKKIEKDSTKPRQEEIPKAEIPEEKIRQRKDTVETKTVQKSKPVKPTKVKPKQVEKENSKPYKNSENYRKYLATLYNQGWTEEEYEEGSKKIKKRVYVSKQHGDEYLQVTHHYGAVYYFKNGQSISYATWIAETEKSAD